MHLFFSALRTLRTLSFVLIAGCVLVRSALAQPLRQPNRYTAEVGGYVATSAATPFWLRANQYGIVPNRTPVLTLRAGIYSDYDTTIQRTGRWRESGYAVGYGLNLVVNAAPNNLPYEKAVVLPEAYVKVRRGVFEAYIGRRREIFGLADSVLSTGSYAWSGNALPVPKIQLSIPEFTPIGFTKGWVAIQGTYGDGLLGGQYIRNTRLHQKSLYLRLGRDNATVRLYGGFTHQVVWGGRAADPTGIPGTIPVGGKLPSGLIDYFYVVTGINKGRTDTTKYTFFDQTNRVGNHVGSIDVAAEFDLVRHTLFVYRQSLIEDGSLYSLINIADGLNGIRLRRNDPNALVRDLLFEVLNTTSQGGDEFVIDDPNKRGRDDYFNHQQYRDGWSYRNHTIGTPFIPPGPLPGNDYPDGTFTFNNRVTVVHLGLSGQLPWRGSAFSGPVTYQAKLSYSRNLGTYSTPYKAVRHQFSGFAQVVAPLAVLDGLSVTAAIGQDAGALYANSFGAFLGVRKTWTR